MAKSVVIVGGGTAGWMTAAYLKKAAPSVNVTLIESANIRSVGVGEATFSTIKLFFDFLGLEEQDWMPSCNATYKLAIKFANWRVDGAHFYHPFQRYETVDGYNMAEWWLKLKQDEEAFDYACFTIPAMCDKKLLAPLLRRPRLRRQGSGLLRRRPAAEEQLPRRPQGPVSLRLPVRRQPARRVPQGVRDPARRQACDRRGQRGQAARGRRHRSSSSPRGMARSTATSSSTAPASAAC